MDLRAVIFVPALAGAVIFGFAFLLFAANYYLTILEGTAAGAKEVTWYSEPAIENSWKLWYMLWLVGLWLGPAYFIGRAMTHGTDAAWIRLAIPLAVIWVCYPVSQLSSLSASTIWLPLVPDVFVRFAQKPLVVLGFLVLSAPVLALFGLGFKWAFLTEYQWQLLFAGAPLMMLAVFLYARLIGRLAFALRFTKGLFPARKKKKPKPDAEPKKPADEEVMPTLAQPADLPPINTIEGELTGYNVLMEDEMPRPRKRVRAEAVEEAEGEPESLPVPVTRSRAEPSSTGAAKRSRSWDDDDDDDARPYEVHAAEAVPEEEKLPEEVVKPRADELALLDRSDAPKKPKRVWGPDVLAFLFQPGTISALVIASGMCFLVGVMVRLARAFNPVSDG